MLGRKVGMKPRSVGLQAITFSPKGYNSCPCLVFPPWGDILPAQPEVLADVDVGGSKAPTISIVCSTGRKSVNGMSVKETVPNTYLLQSFLGEERSCSHTSATAAGTQIRLKRLAQTLRSASLGPRSSLAQVHLLPFSGYKGEVAFSCVLGESRW